MFQSRTDKDLTEIRAQLAELQRQINALVATIAEQPRAPRANWERHSLPRWEETDPSMKPTLVMLSAKIARVTICQSGSQQFVTAYDQAGQAIPAYSGPFRQVGRKILQEYPNLRWEVVAESA